jgi:predicted MFS family arabinose efflux permease
VHRGRPDPARVVVVVQAVVLPDIPPDGRTHLRDLVGVVNPGRLVWILDAAPETPEAASAVNVTNVQTAVAAGSGLGAILVSSTSLRTVFFTAGFIAFQ